MERKLRPGHVLGQGFRAWWRRFARIHLIMLGLLLPLILAAAFIPDGTLPIPGWSCSAFWGTYYFGQRFALHLYFVAEHGLDSVARRGEIAGLGWLFGFLIITVQYAAAAAIVSVLFRSGRGRVPVAPVLARAALLSLLAASAQTVLALFAVALGFEGGSALAVVASVGMGFLALGLASVYWPALPAIAVEHSGVLASLGRSQGLTAGSRLRLGAVVLLVFLLHIILTAVVYIAIPATTAMQIGGAVVAGGFLATLKATVAAAAFDELRTLKEGPRTDLLETVFE